MLKGFKGLLYISQSVLFVSAKVLFLSFQFLIIDNYRYIYSWSGRVG